MRNLKRILMLCLAMLMITSSFCTALAADDENFFFIPGNEYKDIDFNAVPAEEDVFIAQTGLASYSDTTENDVVGILSTLGIMGAYKDTGLFKPNVIISRAEFLEAVTKLKKLQYTENPSTVGTFYDVPNDSPYASMIYTAAKYGIVSGSPNNNFHPDTVISYDEAVTMLVRALGYGELAENLGGYPLGYQNVARRIKLTSGTSVNDTAYLTRIESARLIAKALDTPMNEIGYIDESGINNESGDTVLEIIFDAKKSEGLVESTYFDSLKGKKTTEGKLQIDSALYKGDELYTPFIGYNVTFWYSKDDDSLIYMCNADSVKETVISADNVIDYNNGYLSYYNKSGKKESKDIKKAVLFYNGTIPEVSYGKEVFDIKTGCIRLVANGGSEIDTVKIEEYENLIIRSAVVSNSTVQIRFEEDLISCDLDTDDIYIDVYNSKSGAASVYQTTDKGEKKIVATPFKQYQVASIYAPLGKTITENGVKIPTGEGSYIKIVLSSESVNGDINSTNIGQSKITVGEKEYDVSASNYLGSDYSRLDELEKAEFLVDAYGEIAAVKDYSDSARDGWEYGYIIAAQFSKVFSTGKLEKLRIIDGYGNIVDYDCSEKLKINGKKADEKARAMLSQSAQLLRSGYTLSQLVKYKLNTDETQIIELQTVTDSIGVASGYDKDSQLYRDDFPTTYKTEDDTFGNVVRMSDYAGKYFQPDLIFVVPTTETTDEDYYSTLAEPPEDVGGYVGEAYDLEKLTPGVFVIYEDSTGEKELDTSGEFAQASFYDKMVTKLNSKGDSVPFLTVVGGWGSLEFECEKSVYVETYDGKSIPVSQLERGAVVWLFGKNNKVTKIKPLYYTSGVNDKGESLVNTYVTPDNLPAVGNSTTSFSTNLGELTYCAEAYEYRDSSTFIVQYGEADETGKREFQGMGRYSHKEWMHGGAIMYTRQRSQSPDKATIVATQNASDLRFFTDYGKSCSRILMIPTHGISRQYLIFNIYD